MASGTKVGTAAPQVESLVAAQTRLLREPRSSDLVVKCGEKTWRCQSAILTQRCDFFRAACEGGFKVDWNLYQNLEVEADGLQESATRTIDLGEDDKDSVDMLLLYIYILEGPTDTDSMDWDTAERAYVIGDKYQLLGLVSIGRTYIERAIEDDLPKIGSSPKEDMQGVVRGWTCFIARVLNHKLPNADSLELRLLKGLINVSKYMIREPRFQKLLEDNKEFSLRLMTALAEKASRC